MKTWEQLLIDAAEFITFLEKGDFFKQPYTTTKNHRIIRDPQLAMDIAADYAGDNYPDREDTFESNFPESFEWNLGRLDNKLQKNDFFGYAKQNFNGADEKLLAVGVCCVLRETMYIDCDLIFKCYANGYFTELVDEIRQVYLDGGFPCGWAGDYPKGRLVVFSNE